MITTYRQNEIIFTIRTKEINENLLGGKYFSTLNISNHEDRLLNTIEDIWGKDFERGSIN